MYSFSFSAISFFESQWKDSSNEKMNYVIEKNKINRHIWNHLLLLSSLPFPCRDTNFKHVVSDVIPYSCQFARLAGAIGENYPLKEFLDLVSQWSEVDWVIFHRQVHHCVREGVFLAGLDWLECLSDLGGGDERTVLGFASKTQFPRSKVPITLTDNESSWSPLWLLKRILTSECPWYGPKKLTHIVIFFSIAISWNV